MHVQRMDHVGIVVKDLVAAKEFFLALGLTLEGEAELGGAFVEDVIGLEGVRDTVAYMRTPSGEAAIELIQFHSPIDETDAPLPESNTLGIRHIAFAVDDVDAVVEKLQVHGARLVGKIVQYEDMYRLCYIRGPEGIILELAQPL